MSMKRIAITFVVLAVLITLYFTAQVGLGRFVQKKIEEKVVELTREFYRVEIDRVEVRLIDRSVRLRGITVQTDSAQWERHDRTWPHLEGAVGQLSLTGIRWVRSNDTTGGTLALKTLTFDAPDLRISGEQLSFATQRGDTTARRLSPGLTVAGVQVEAGNIDLCRWEKKDTAHLQVSGLQATLDSLAISPRGGEKSSWKQAAATLEKVSYSIPGKDKTVAGDSLAFDTQSEQLTLARMQVISHYPKEHFTQRSRSRRDWIDVDLRELSAHRIQAAEWFRHRRLFIDSISLGSARVHSYKNRQIPVPERVKPLIHESLANFPFAFAIRHITFSDTQATYEELPLQGKTAGIVHFTGMRGDWSDLSNIPGYYPQASRLITFGKLMETGVVEADIRLPVSRPQDRFRITGTLKSMPFSAINPIITPLAHIRINTGELHRLDFTVSGDSVRSGVRLDLRYDRLNIEVLKREGRRSGGERVVLSELANLILKESNPDIRGHRIAETTTERNPRRSAFNYLWHSLLDGVKVTVGIPHNK